jgi:hypothetical protein
VTCFLAAIFISDTAAVRSQVPHPDYFVTYTDCSIEDTCMSSHLRKWEMVRAAQAVCSRGGRGRWNRKRQWRCLGPLGSGLCDLIPPLAPRPWVPSGLWDGTGQAAGTPSCPESPEATSSQPAALAGQLHPQTQVFPDRAVMRKAMDGSLLFMTSVRAGSGRCCAGTHLSFL